MQYLIVGTMLAIIIFTAAWFIAFTNYAANKKSELAETLTQLNELLDKRQKTLNGYGKESREYRFIEEGITRCYDQYNQKVLKYNRLLNAFPNRYISQALGFTVLSRKNPDAADDEP